MTKDGTDTNDYEDVGQDIVSRIFGENATAVEASQASQETFLENSNNAYFVNPSEADNEEATFTLQQITMMEAIPEEDEVDLLTSPAA